MALWQEESVLLVIVDYGLGNSQSVLNMLAKIGVRAVISNDHAVLASADKLILPGVGAFDSGMCNLRRDNLVDILSELVIGKKVPILGICLGMQLFAKSSEEGVEPGLGWLNARVVRFSKSSLGDLKVPNMGWRQIEAKSANDVLFTNMSELMKFYFVHSYHMVCECGEDVAAVSQYGAEYVVAIARGNIYGVQFHPEKSHKYGMQLLRNFCGMS
jgi:imidazole glycerol-phosphate synthase subunit HisH